MQVRSVSCAMKQLGALDTNITDLSAYDWSLSDLLHIFG